MVRGRVIVSQRSQVRVLRFERNASRSGVKQISWSPPRRAWRALSGGLSNGWSRTWLAFSV